MLRKKYKRILCIIVAFIIAFSCFCFSASAEEQVTTFDDFWTYNTSDGKYYIVSSDGSTITDVTSKTVVSFANDGAEMIITLTPTTTVSVGDRIMMELIFDLKPGLVKLGYSNLSFNVFNYYNYRISYDLDSSVAKRWAFTNDATTDVLIYDRQSADLSASGTNNAYLTVDYPDKNYDLYGFNTVVLSLYFDIYNLTSSSAISVRLEFSDLVYNYSTENEYLNNKLTLGWNGDGINAEYGSSDIQDAEDNALNENYKLLVGYDVDTGEPIYSEGSLQDMGKATISSVGDTVTSFLSTPQSLMAFTEFFSRILYTPKLNLLVYISLALGVLPLIYGLTINTSTSFIHRFSNRKE